MKYTYGLKVLTPKVNWAKVEVADWYLNNSLYFSPGEFEAFLVGNDLSAKWDNALHTLKNMGRNYDGFFEEGELENAFFELLKEYDEWVKQNPDEELMYYMAHFLSELTPDFTLYWVPDLEDYFEDCPDEWEEAFEVGDEDDPYVEWEYIGYSYQEVDLGDFLSKETKDYV